MSGIGFWRQESDKNGSCELPTTGTQASQPVTQAQSAEIRPFNFARLGHDLGMSQNGGTLKMSGVPLNPPLNQPEKGYFQ